MFGERTCQRPTTRKGGNVVKIMLNADMTFALRVLTGRSVGVTPASCAHVVA
jgi:hypothetical protein